MSVHDAAWNSDLRIVAYTAEPGSVSESRLALLAGAGAREGLIPALL